MTHTVHPQPIFQQHWDSQKSRTVWEQTGFMPGMTVKQLWMGQMLVAMTNNPATMLDPEHHVDYAVKLINLAYNKLGDG